MKMKIGFAIAMLIVLGLLLTGCSSSGSVSAVEATIEAMPQPSPKLYLGEETLSLSLPPNATASIYAKTFTNDWVFDLSGQVLKETFTYNLSMASAGQSNVNVEIILKQGSQENVLGGDSFLVSSDQYQPYRGQITGSNVTTKNGD
jgi:hypothetical protein